MSAELARRMLDEGAIDLVICFAPSREVVQGFQSTLEFTVGKRFDGKLGAYGSALTYQAMDHLKDDFWALFRNYRVLAIFDEIHHCAETEPGHSNRWGQLIVQRIQDHATYTLALSGTPWRSDELGIALARYSTPEGHLICDFRYSLSDAVADKVCRSPRIVVMDNDDVRLTVSTAANQKTKKFDCVAGLLKDSVVRYQDLLDNQQAQQYMLQTANEKLDELRLTVPDAAGLIVASTIEHACLVAEVLETLNQSVMVVTSDSPDARNQIHQFRKGNQRWIVAVGMVAEGTDIPRIQVCCHLTRIRTELHFRQVLGRALRRRGESDALAWMYIYAEPTLTEFASRVADDLPLDRSVLSVSSPSERGTNVDCEPKSSGGCLGILPGALPTPDKPNATGVGFQKKHRTLAFSDRFRHQLLAIF